MSLEYPCFLVNLKTYAGTAGDDALALARTIERVAERTGATVAVAPGTPDLARIAAETSLPVVAQAVDAAEHGAGHGRITLPGVAAAGADGVLVNHPERPDAFGDVADLVAGCRDLGLESIVCVDGLDVGRVALELDPDCVLFEDPSDIATGESMVETRPERAEAFIELVADRNPRTRVLLGGGITSGADVERALALGADAAGAASAFVEADDREAWLASIADGLDSGGA